MTTDCGGCLRTRAEVSPRQVTKYLASIAFVHVSRAGNSAVAYTKAMPLAVQGLVEVLCGVSGAVLMFAVGATGRHVAGIATECAAGDVAGMSTRHRPQERSLCPVRATRPWSTTRTVMLMNIKVDPLSMRAPTDISDPDVRDGKISARPAATGRLERGWIPSCVYIIETPSGRPMLI